MNYRRALLLLEPGTPAGPATALIRRVAPRLERLLIIATLPVKHFSWFFDSHASHGQDERDEGSLAVVRSVAQGIAPSIDLQLAPVLGSDALAALCAAEDSDLFVFGSRSLSSASVVSLRRKCPGLAVLWAAEGPASGPIEDIGCVVMDEGSRAAMGAFLRDHADPSMHVALLSPSSLSPDALAAEVSGIEAKVEASSPLDAPSMRQWLDEWTRHRRIDLLVFARIPTALLLGGLWTAPVLLVPFLAPSRPFGERALDVADLVDQGGPLRMRVDNVAAVGDLAPIPDQALAVVSAGHVVATLTTRAGEVELPAGLEVASLGVYRIRGTAPLDPTAAIEQRVAVIRRGKRPLVLFDAEVPEAFLLPLSAIAAPLDLELLAVRLRPSRSCRSIRQRLRAVGLSPRVADARAILDEGEALDISDALDPVRLGRVASRLGKDGFPVVAIVHRGPAQPIVSRFAALSVQELQRDPGALEKAVASIGAQPLWASELKVGATDGNRIELELDNRTARGWLLEAIGQSMKTLNVQVYMGLDDDVGRPVEAALAAAGARGVNVRVLVDSLHGLHGSFGTRNPLFERLAARPGVEVRVSRPITELPSILDLKQRDHRKVVIADGRLALVGGRNLSHEYYTAFDEVELRPESLWREVPWLDAGARLEGPVVALASSSFLDAWTEAGGQPFEIVSPPPAGGSSARFVVHRGLRDARTLEAYLELIETAKSHVYAVNGFPLALELQHALLRALGRGVRVRALIGHLTPTHDARAFGGPWAAARSVATELVHSRMDPVVAAGGEAFLFAQRDHPGWAGGLGIVHPHVHAKALSVDGRRCAVGSANLDVTASYWESELLLVVDDAELTRAFEARIESLIAGSVQMKRDDPVWQGLAKRRAWMRHWPGVLSA